jgi:predicted nucleic acid-binding protein
VAAASLFTLSRGAVVLIDANIFIYAFIHRSGQCRLLLERCKDEEVFGITTAEVVSEVCHRLMLIEAVDTGIITKPLAASLRVKPAEIRKLSRYWALTSRIFNLNIVVLPLDDQRLRRAQQVRTTYGLLTTDSLIVATALEYGIESQASRDHDFEQIQELAVFKPTDVP